MISVTTSYLLIYNVPFAWYNESAYAHEIMMVKQIPQKILFVAAEVAPFASVGGLSQVMYFLPKTLKSLGHDVAIFMPKYGTIIESKYRIKSFIKNLAIPTGETEGVTKLICNVKIKEGTKKEPTVYFLENMEYFEKRANVYGYADDETRFNLLSRGVLEFLKMSKWIPDVIHLNDWHTAYVANYMRNAYNNDSKIKNISTVFTIHNMAHQGNYDFHFTSPMNFDDGKGPLASFFSPLLKKQNALKRGIINSDIVNTVSQRYSREIMTAEYGEGLDMLLKEVRAKVYGVLNGLDYTDFNPATDTFIVKNYSIKTVSDRVQNKIELQKEFNLPINSEIPILAMSGRLDAQKGIDLLMKVIPFLLKEYEIQFIVMGHGDHRYREFFNKLEKEFPKQVATHLMANWQLPRKIYAGSDIFLLPSKFEPGGIVVIEAMRYGSVPVVHKVGGLSDTIEDFDIDKNTGTGFTFSNYSELSLFGALSRALEVYKSKRLWKMLVTRAMRVDFSWEVSAQKYQDLYNRAISFRELANQENPAPAFR